MARLPYRRQTLLSSMIILDPLLCAEPVLARGCKKILAIGAACVQVFPRATICQGGFSVPIPERCIGGLTGSRVAGGLGDYLVRDSIASSLHLSMVGLMIQGINSLFSIGVDNIYSIAASRAHAVENLHRVEFAFKSRWGLTFKPGSATYISGMGAASGQTV